MKTFAVRKEGKTDMYELRFKKLDAKEGESERVVHIVHYKNWQLARPIDPCDLLNVIRSTWSCEIAMAAITENQEPVTLVHGSSGVRRTGTFVVTAILCKQVDIYFN